MALLLLRLLMLALLASSFGSASADQRHGGSHGGGRKVRGVKDVQLATRELGHRRHHDSSRCWGASCVPKVAELRRHASADLRRPLLLPNDKAVAMGGLDQAVYDLEQFMMGDKLDEGILTESRGGTILGFREQMEYDMRVATSPAIRVVCEIGFLCGQSTIIWLESNPTLKVISFDENAHWLSDKCVEFIQKRYPGRLTFTKGLSHDSVPRFIKEHSDAQGAYTGPKCDIVRTDARAEYELRRADFVNMQTMMHCNTLILHNDVCQPERCQLYAAQNCMWKYGVCEPQNPLFFEGPTLLLQELIRSGVVEKLDSFHYTEPKFYKSWALSRAQCGPDGRVRPLPAAPMFGGGKAAAFAARMKECHGKGGCEGRIEV